MQKFNPLLLLLETEFNNIKYQMRQKKTVEMRKVLSNQCDKMLETMQKFKSPKNNNGTAV
jgi:hypothetical protein